MKKTGFIWYYVVPLGIFLLSIAVTQVIFHSTRVPLFRNFLFSLLLVAIPAVLVYLVGVAVVRIANELRKGRLGSRFQARVLFGFFTIIIITVLPLFFFLNGFFQRSFDLWFLEDLSAALDSANEMTLDRNNADRLDLKDAAARLVRQTAGDWKAASVPESLRQESLSFFRIFRDGKTVFAWSDKAENASLLSASDLVDYDLRDDLFLTKTKKGEPFLIYVVRLPGTEPAAFLAAARKISPTVYARSQRIEKGYLLYRQLNLLQKPYRQALSVLMADFGLFVLLLALILSILLARQISKPVLQIYEGIQQIAAGRLDHFIDYPRNDEMRVLVQAFNNMTKELFFNHQAILHSQHIEAWKQIAVRQIDDLKRQGFGLLKMVKKAMEELDEQDPRRQELADIVVKVQEMERLTQQFESFATVPKLTLRKENLSEVIREVMEIFEGSRANVSFFVELDNSMPLVNVNRAQLYQALVNLVKNAVEAIPARQKGLVKIRTQSVVNLQGGFVKVEVIDNGTGIQPASVPRIWEAYYSTKKAKQGLGLTIVKRIVEEHGGRVSYRRAEGRSVFTVEFPV